MVFLFKTKLFDKVNAHWNWLSTDQKEGSPYIYIHIWINWSDIGYEIDELEESLIDIGEDNGKNWRVWKIKEKLNGLEDEENEDCLSLGTKGKYILTQSHQYVGQHVDPFLEIYFHLYQSTRIWLRHSG